MALRAAGGVSTSNTASGSGWRTQKVTDNICKMEALTGP